jgi:hypothetical protein
MDHSALTSAFARLPDTGRRVTSQTGFALANTDAEKPPRSLMTVEYAIAGPHGASSGAKGIGIEQWNSSVIVSSPEGSSAEHVTCDVTAACTAMARYRDSNSLRIRILLGAK